MKSHFDGRQLVLTTGHAKTVLIALLLVFAGTASTFAMIVVPLVVLRPGAGVVTAGVLVAVAAAAALVWVTVRRVRRYPRPTLRVTPEGVDVAMYGDRWQVPWADVTAVGRVQSPLGDLYYAVDVDPAYWERVGRRFHEVTERESHARWLDVSDKITFPVVGMPLSTALRHTRQVAPDSVRVATTR